MTRHHISLVSAILVFLPLKAYCQCEPFASWEYVWTAKKIYYVDHKDYLRLYAPPLTTPPIPGHGGVRYQYFNTGLCGGHCQASDGTKFPHKHFQFFTLGQNGLPAPQWVNLYWDFRFLTNEWTPDSKCERISSADNLNVGNLTYALQQTGPGIYNYFMDNRHSGFDAMWDHEQVDSADVAPNDLLVYGTSHVSVVEAVSGEEPTRLRWRIRDSGVYAWDVPVGCVWSTPFNSNHDFYYSMSDFQSNSDNPPPTYEGRLEADQIYNEPIYDQNWEWNDWFYSFYNGCGNAPQTVFRAGS